MSFLSRQHHNVFSKGDDLSLCTHLAIGAHPDDVEIMAGHGIEACLTSKENQFVAVVVTTGAGSTASKNGLSNLVETRQKEQIEAAQKGNYLACIQMGWASEDIKSGINQTVVKELRTLFEKCQPKVVYTHNPFDKHLTHVAVWAHVIAALQDVSVKPEFFYGCEVWRGLDWLSYETKILLPVKNPQLIEELIRCHKSQDHADKSYSLATLGRMRANATFFDAYRVEDTRHAVCAMDISSFLVKEGELVQECLKQFKDSVEEALQNFSGDLKWK